MDGISTVSAVWGGTSVITPSEDSVQDVTIVTNSYDAENGRFSGAHIQVTSKSGTNQLHGSLFFKASRPGLNAYQRWNGYVANAGNACHRDKGVNRDDERTNNYGASLGGPIWKNKIFAFFNYETSPDAATSTGKVGIRRLRLTPRLRRPAALPQNICPIREKEWRPAA